MNRGLSIIFLLLVAVPSPAQDLEPRSFSQAPVGMNFAALTYAHATGEVLFDQATTITDAHGRVNTVLAAYVRTLDVLGASGKFTAVLPYSWGHWHGLLDGQYVDTSRAGFPDPRLQLAVNFVGAPAITMSEMKNYQKHTVVGASLQVVVPLGQYKPDKLINLGQNRWALRPRLGMAQRIGRLTLEGMADVWLFTANPDFYGGKKVTQDPLYALQINAIYQARAGFWFGVGGGISRGGKTASDGVYGDSYKKNTRWAAIISYPLTARHSVNLLYIDGVRTRLGADFDQISASFQIRWGGEN